MNFDRIFIVTYGRSGSTLLQGVLNSIPGACIRGENGNALALLVESFAAAEQAKNDFGHWAQTPENPWFGADQINLSTYGRGLVAAFERSVLRPPRGASVIGFKEIRYAVMEHEAFRRTIDFARRFFVNPAFIVNTRSLDSTIASATRTGMGMASQQFTDADAMLREFVSEGASDVFHVHYDDYARDASALRGLFDFLGAPFNEASIRDVLNKKHSTFAEPVSG